MTNLASLPSISLALIQSKCALPAPRRNLVARPALHALLDQALDHPLTIIKAPAGFGKTTLLANWLVGRHGLARYAWLSLDASDDDPIQFWSYLFTGLDQLQPGAMTPLLGLLNQLGAAALPGLLARALNELARSDTQRLLVLDDYHSITNPAIHALIDDLLVYLPATLHLVITTRSEPPLRLSRLRGRGAILELGPADLRFAPAEAAQFLRQTMALQLPPSVVKLLSERTEGWIAGLQLAALALRNDPLDASTTTLGALTSGNRYLFDYLVQEVLTHQPPHLQAFLLQTSIVDLLCGSLCDALMLGVAPPPDESAYSTLVLEQLEQAELFLIRLPEQRQFYRYHHLFAEVLRERLRASVRPGVIVELHRRASHWFAANGFARWAVDHALAARDWDLAGSLLERFGYRLLTQGHLTTVAGWLEQLPETFLRHEPALLVIKAFYLALTGDMEASAACLDAAEQLLQPDDHSAATRNLRGKIANRRRDIVWDNGDIARAIALDREALRLLDPDEQGWRLAAHVMEARSFHLSGEVTPAREHQLERLLAEVQAYGHYPLIVGSLYSLALLRRLQGRLNAVAATFSAIELTGADQQSDRLLVLGQRYRAVYGDLLAERGQLEEAASYLEPSVAEMRTSRIAQAEYIRLAFSAMARVRQAQGKPAAALAVMDDFLTLARQRGYHAHIIEPAEAWRACLLLWQGDLHSASVWAATSGLNAAAAELSFPHEPAYLALVRTWLAQAYANPQHADLDHAERLLTRLLDQAGRAGRNRSVIEALVLRALVRAACNDEPRALADLERALVIAAPEGFIQIFADEGVLMAALLARRTANAPPGDRLHSYVEQIRQRCHPGVAPDASPKVPPAPSALAEPLTAREHEVLLLLALGLTNKTIAQRLTLSSNTVHSHVKAIFGKLGVTTRTEAAARARALGLITD